MAKFKGWAGDKVSLLVIKNGKVIGDMFWCSRTLDGSCKLRCKNTCFDLGNTLNLNDELKIKDTNTDEVYNCKIVFLSEIRNFDKFLYCENIECTFKQYVDLKKEEDHIGQIYNPYNDSWSWL